MKNAIIAVTVASCLLSLTTARADDTVDQRIESLEKEVVKLEQQVQWLRQALKKANEHPARVDDPPVEGEVFSSVVDILKAMPDELQPHQRKGWDKFAIDKVDAWLKKNPVGEKFEARMEVYRAHVRRNPAATVNPSAQKWKLEVILKEKVYKYHGLALNQRMGWPAPLVVYGDEEFAKKAERIKQGQFVTVKGLIHTIILGNELQGRRPFRITLTEETIESKVLD